MASTQRYFVGITEKQAQQVLQEPGRKFHPEEETNRQELVADHNLLSLSVPSGFIPEKLHTKMSDDPEDPHSCQCKSEGK